jgi:hypothetical protein
MTINLYVNLKRSNEIIKLYHKTLIFLNNLIRLSKFIGFKATSSIPDV